MEVRYREAFLRDLRKLKKHPEYDRVRQLAFETLPAAGDLREIPGVKALRDHPRRYRIRLGDHRIGVELVEDMAVVVRVLHRKDFYRFFP